MKIHTLFLTSMEPWRGNTVLLLSEYLDVPGVRDNICRAIQYGSKLVAGGEAGVAHDVDSSTALARKVFRLLKSINEVEGLFMVPSTDRNTWRATLSKSTSSLMAVYFALDNVVWAGKVGILKDKKLTNTLSNISLYFFLGGCVSDALREVNSLLYFKRSLPENHKSELSTHILGLVKSSMNVLVAIGLLQLAPKRVTPRVTGALGLVTSLIACYELFPKLHKVPDE